VACRAWRTMHAQRLQTSASAQFESAPFSKEVLGSQNNFRTTCLRKTLAIRLPTDGCSKDTYLQRKRPPANTHFQIIHGCEFPILELLSLNSGLTPGFLVRQNSGSKSAKVDGVLRATLLHSSADSPCNKISFLSCQPLASECANIPFGLPCILYSGKLPIAPSRCLKDPGS
jgi:hypothetical protein